MSQHTHANAPENERNKRLWRKAEQLIPKYKDMTLREIYFILKREEV